MAMSFIFIYVLSMPIIFHSTWKYTTLKSPVPVFSTLVKIVVISPRIVDEESVFVRVRDGIYLVGNSAEVEMVCPKDVQLMNQYPIMIVFWSFYPIISHIC